MNLFFIQEDKMTQQQLLKHIKTQWVTREELDRLEQKVSLQQLPTIPPTLFHEPKCFRLIDFVSPKNILKNEDEILLYHGTNMSSAMDMIDKGVQIVKSHGVLGTGFYVTPSISEALRWSRRGKPKVVIAFAIKKGSEATVGCIQRNSKFERHCVKDCTLFTAYDTVMIHRPGGYLPFFWQYVITDQRLFDSKRIIIKKVYILVGTQRFQMGGAA